MNFFLELDEDREEDECYRLICDDDYLILDMNDYDIVYNLNKEYNPEWRVRQAVDNKLIHLYPEEVRTFMKHWVATLPCNYKGEHESLSTK